MKLLCALVAAPVLSWGALCDDAYVLKSATQILFSGGDPGNLSREARSVKTDLSDLEILHPAMEYALIESFSGACGKVATTLGELRRPPDGDSFSSVSRSGYYAQLFDSTSHPNGLTFSYWFGFFRPADSLKGFVGRPKGGDNYFSNWYAAMMVVDSTRNAESGLWSKSTTLLALQGPTDSASLDKSFLDAYRKQTYDANHRAFFTVQFIKVGYGPNVVATRASLRPATMAAPSPLRGCNLLGQTLRKGKP